MPLFILLSCKTALAGGRRATGKRRLFSAIVPDFIQRMQGVEKPFFFEKKNQKTFAP
jgi:hypothetical protein